MYTILTVDTSLVENSFPSNYGLNSFSTIIKIENNLSTTNYFFQLVITRLDKYKLSLKLQSMIMATCQHHANN
jgi:outer membrane translocation and assembly module TamA